MPEQPKTLTVAKLKKLPFRLCLHLNCGKERHRSEANEEYGLLISTTCKGPPYFSVIRKILTAPRRLPEDHQCDLTAKDLDAELSRFVDAYNAVEALPE